MGGGTSAGKTYSGLIGVLIHCATVAPPQVNPVFSIISPTVPKIKQTTLRDWEQIRVYEPACIRINKTDRIYQLNGWTIEFIAFDDEGKARGPRRQHALIDEANLFRWSIIDALLDRTAGTTIFTYNPTNRFEVHDLIEKHPNNIARHYRLNYKDNKHVPPKTKARIESWEYSNPRKWRVMGLGYLGKTEGLVYPDYNLNPFPEDLADVKRQFWGIDFGYTSDPTALIQGAVIGADLYLRQHYYAPTPTTDLAVDAISSSPYNKKLTMAAERDVVMVNAINVAGYTNVVMVEKPPGSIKSGIALVNNYRLNLDPASPDLINEVKSYSKKEIGEGIFGDPIDADNHLLDALRYSVMHYHNPPKPKGRQAGNLITWKV